MSTPRTITNRPGLSALNYRVGAYGDFFDTMLESLSGRTGSAAAFAGLTTRSLDDPSIALLEAFSCVCDVLTFYQERLANEGYLRTATERRSLIELANLTGYKPRPGVDASVFLAYTLQVGGAVTIPAGSRAQNVPGPGATAQMFETSSDLDARPEWNAMKPRLLRPTQPDPAVGTVFLQGTDTVPKAGDPLLVVANGTPVLRRVAKAQAQFDRQRVQVTLVPPPGAAIAVAEAVAPAPAVAARVAVPMVERRRGITPRSLAFSETPSATPASTAITPASVVSGTVVSGPIQVPAPTPPSPGSVVAQEAEDFRLAAIKPPASYPASPQLLTRSPALLFAPQTETALALKTSISPQQQSAIYQALGQYTVADTRSLAVHSFRANTTPFGSRAPLQVIPGDATNPMTMREWTLTQPAFSKITLGIVPSGTLTLAAAATPLVTASGAPAAAAPVIATTITIDSTTARLPVAEQQGQKASVTLSDALGAVSVTVEHFTANPLQMTLSYEFAKLALTIVVTDNAGQTATATGVGSGAAGLILTVSDARAAGGPGLLVTGAQPAGTVTAAPGQGASEQPTQLYLDGVFETVAPQSWVAFDAPADMGITVPTPLHAISANTVTRVAYGQVARTTRLLLDADWIDPAKDGFAKIRNLAVYADSVPLTLALEDVTEPVSQTASDASLELDGLYPGLASGRYVLVSGERMDMPGVIATELVMIAGAEHTLEASAAPVIAVPAPAAGAGAPEAAVAAPAAAAPPAAPVAAAAPAAPAQVPLAGETVHTVLTFSSPLAYSYKRDTVTIYGNVVRATQGETQNEVLGSGNGAVTNQSFVLKKPPLTYLSAATASGSISTLRVMVNGVAWTELPQLTQAGPNDRVYVVQIAENNAVTVQFGDGIHGARLPSGVENVRAQYRSGLGLSGNVDGSTITTLMSRPLGVQSVTNPQPASGGADRESEGCIREHVPLGLTALDRLVSVADYQDFCASFAGVGKAQAQLFSGSEGPLVHVTLAGSADAPLDPNSAMWNALTQSLRLYGDPAQPFTLAARRLRMVLAVASIGVDPAYQWVELEPRLRAAVLTQFGFDRRSLGQTMYTSELVTAMQQVAGVDHVNLRCMVGISYPFPGDVLQTVAQSSVVEDVLAPAAHVDLASGRRQIVPAELAVFSDAVPDMLLLSPSAS